MTKEGSIAVSIGLLALIIIVAIIAITRIKPPAIDKTTPSPRPAEPKVRSPGQDQPDGGGAKPGLPFGVRD